MVMAKAEIFISVLKGGAIEIAYFNLSCFINYFNPYKLPRLHELPRASARGQKNCKLYLGFSPFSSSALANN
jgi:hypothetical protein